VGGFGGGGGVRGEMTQALYAHMNNKTIKKKEREVQESKGEKINKEITQENF
jgi:hypothetical protein